MKCAVVYNRITDGASADELDVLKQVDSVSASLAEIGFEPVPIPFDLDIPGVIRSLTALKPELVFNLVESVNGLESMAHLAAMLFHQLGIPYTGAAGEAIFLTGNKLIAKRILCKNGLPTPRWMDAKGRNVNGSGFPGDFIVKSVWEHSSVGMDGNSVLFGCDSDTLMSRIQERQSTVGGSFFAEEFIQGREFNIAILSGETGPEILVHAEILFEGFGDRPKIVDYQAKWDEMSFEYRNTQRSYTFSEGCQGVLDQLSDLSLKCWKLFDLTGYARVDYRVDHGNRPWILEINTNPCLSEDAGFAAALTETGLTYTQAVQRIVDDAFRRKFYPSKIHLG